jgi:hypothetical protein
MDQCSDYIGKLEGYRKLNVMATAGKMNNLKRHQVKTVY